MSLGKNKIQDTVRKTLSKNKDLKHYLKKRSKEVPHRTCQIQRSLSKYLKNVCSQQSLGEPKVEKSWSLNSAQTVVRHGFC